MLNNLNFIWVENRNKKLKLEKLSDKRQRGPRKQKSSHLTTFSNIFLKWKIYLDRSDRMGDSEDEYQSHNTGNLGHNGNNSIGNGGVYNNSFNNKKNTNRDKFYRERDDSANTGYNNNSRNNNDSRRDWSNDRGNRGNNDSYKNNRMGNQSSYGYGHQGGGGGMGGAGGYQRMSHSDYPKKYSHQSPNAGDSSPPPYKRNRRDYDDSGSRSHGDSMYSSPSGGGYNSSSHQKSQ